MGDDDDVAGTVDHGRLCIVDGDGEAASGRIAGGIAHGGGYDGGAFIEETAANLRERRRTDAGTVVADAHIVSHVGAALIGRRADAEVGRAGNGRRLLIQYIDRKGASSGIAGSVGSRYVDDALSFIEYAAAWRHGGEWKRTGAIVCDTYII